MKKKSKNEIPFTPLSLSLLKDFSDKDYDYDNELIREAIGEYFSTHKVEKEKKEVALDIDEEELFGDIDKAIALLTELKNEGYTRFKQEWFGYEDNGFFVYKDRLENDEELYDRIRKEIKKILDRKEHEQMEKEKKQKQIAEYERKIKEIRKTL